MSVQPQHERGLTEKMEVMTIDPLTRENYKSPLLSSWRFWTIMLAMVCTVQLMMVRMSLSMALVCMVDPSHHHHRHNTTFETSHQNNQKLVNADAICPQQSDNINIEQLHIGEFNWSKSTQGQLLCSYFYGYILGIYAGGVATDRWGGRLFMLLSIGTMAITNFILPTAANTHHRALYAVRVIQGLAEALGLNAHQYLLTRWGTNQDLSLLTGLSYAGFPLGVMIIHPLVSSLCLHGPWGGWPSVFYLLGGLGAVWTLVASLFLHDSPSSHPYVTPAEIQYFRQYSQRINTNVRGIVKWKSLVGSSAVWALLATSAFSSFGYFTFTLHQPLFLRDVFGLSIDQNGIMSSILWVLELPVSLGVGIVVDALRRNRASLTLTKKICNTIGLVLAGVTPIVVVEVEWCGWRGLAAAALALVVVGNCMSFVGGYYYTPVDLVPSCAATLSGLASTFIGLNGLLAPILVAWLTPTGSRDEWKTVFWVSGGTYLLGALVFLVWGSADPVPWAVPSHAKHRLTSLEVYDERREGSEEQPEDRIGDMVQERKVDSV